MTTPDPDPDRTPDLPGGSVPPGETPPSSSQTSGVAHQEEPPANGISWGFLVAIVVLVLVIAGAGIAGGLSMF